MSCGEAGRDSITKVKFTLVSLLRQSLGKKTPIFEILRNLHLFTKKYILGWVFVWVFFW